MEKMKTCTFMMEREEGRKSILLSQRTVVGKGQDQTTQFSRRFALDSFPLLHSPYLKGRAEYGGEQ